MPIESQEEPTQTEYLARPDPDRPDFFLDEDYTVQLKTLPAAGPVWLAYGSPSSFSLAVFQGFVFFVASLLDRRWKVVTYRQPRRRPSLPRVVGVDFAPSEDAAEALRKHLLEGWRPGQVAEKPPVGAVARLRAWRSR